MTVTTLSSRELNHDLGHAKKAAQQGPVIITDRGKPAHVLMSYELYQRLIGQQRSLVDALAMPGLAQIDFDPAPSRIHGKPADLS
ncbi:type II toxin-antitoxin system Phd/YefM family antitoxin [Alcaligenes sp. Marseille-Q7550]